MAPAYLAIIAPRPEEAFLSDSIVSREAPVHVASLIGLVALFIIAFTLLSDNACAKPETRVARGSRR